MVQNSVNKEFEHKETLLALYKEKAEIERSFDDENKTVVNFEDETIEEIKEETCEYDLEL